MMLSSDKNVETIGQLVEAIHHYLTLQKEYVKLDVAEKLVQLLTVAALAIIGLLLAIAIAMFLSFALGMWLSSYVGITAAFLLVSAFHLLTLVLLFIFRRSWIERPLVRILTNILMNKQ